MSTVLIGLWISFLSVLFFISLFWYENRRGARFFEHVRVRIDFFVLKGIQYIHKGGHYMMNIFVRQAVHYLFHTLLRSILGLVKGSEKGLRNVMRINKTLAKRAERESSTRSKLEEIAIHKAANALTEDEKRIRKAKMLQGNPHQ